MASSDRIDELKRKFDENPRRYFAPLANEFRKSGDFEQAIRICQEFLPQQPGHMSGHIVYGQALYESSKLDEARGVFETALSLDPENLIALRHLGDIAGRQGDPATARRWYERVLEADPRNDEIHVLIGALGAPQASPVATSQPHDAERVASDPEVKEADPRPVLAHADTAELLDFDVSLPDARPAGAGAAETKHEDPTPSPFGGAIIPGIEPTPETAELMPAVEGRTEGFEPGEFSAPATPIDPTPGLQSSYEVETGVHPIFFAPLPGLDRPETTAEPVPAVPTTSAFPELDEALPEDRGEVVPPHGDPIADSAPAPSTAGRDETLLDFEMPFADEASDRTAGPSASQPSEPPRVEADPLEPGRTADASPPTIPAELPPEVIAAEAELIDAGMSIEQPPPRSRDAEETHASDIVGAEMSFLDVDEPAREDVGDSVVASAVSPSEPDSSEADSRVSERGSGPAPSADRTPVEPRPFVTETMAELYLKQGFRQEALSVYEQLGAANPADERLGAKVASLRAELAAPARRSGPPVREYFAKFAARRPGERAAAAAPPAFDDFGPSEAAAPTHDDVSTRAASEYDTPPARAASDTAVQGTPTPHQAGGSIDALFGHQSIGAPDDSAASALAQAFGAAGDTAPITGNPARPATGELTLDSVFREGGARGPRSSQGFSFDQFFSQRVDGDRTSGGGDVSGEATDSGEPAKRSEDDIEQFNSWLQGLKQR